MVARPRMLVVAGPPGGGKTTLLLENQARLSESRVEQCMHRTQVTVLVVFLFAFGVRLWSIEAVLPFIHHPDEPEVERVAMKVARDFTESPKFFNYPSASIYIQAAALRGYEVVTRKNVVETHTLSLGNARASDSGHWIVGRTVTALVSALTACLLAWMVSFATSSSTAAACAGFCAAFSPLLVGNGRHITPDSYAALFAVAALALCAHHSMRLSGASTVIGAGIAIGLAAGSKYNAAAFSLSVLAAVLSTDIRALRSPTVYLAGLAATATFLLTTPFALLDFSEFYDDFAYEARHYRSGHVGLPGGALDGYLRAVWETENLRLLLIPFALLAKGPVRRCLLVVTVGAGAYFCLMCSMQAHFPRNLVPLLPFVCLLEGTGAYAITGALRARVSRLNTSRVLRHCVALGLLAALSLTPARKIRDEAFKRLQNPREVASRWIEANIPRGAFIGVEAYAPWIEPEQFRIGSRYFVKDFSKTQRGSMQYLVLARGAYGRFFDDPKRFRSEVKFYQSLWSGGCAIAEFNRGEEAEIRVIDTACTRSKAKSRARTQSPGKEQRP